MGNNLHLYLRRGCVYRRSELGKTFKGIDRELARLVAAQVLVRIRRGLYECPMRSRYGLLPPSPNKLVQAFLRDVDFLIISPNDYNTLGFGTSQLYNYRVVYNHKRRGRFEFDGQVFEFRIRSDYPKKVSPEFLLVDLLNSLQHLAEDRVSVLANVKARLPKMCSEPLLSAVRRFANASTRKYFEGLYAGGLDLNPLIDQIYQRASEITGSPEAARLWLETPNYGLGFRRPIDLTDCPDGAKEVLDLLGRIQHGVFS